MTLQELFQCYEEMPDFKAYVNKMMTKHGDGLATTLSKKIVKYYLKSLLSNGINHREEQSHE